MKLGSEELLSITRIFGVVVLRLSASATLIAGNRKLISFLDFTFYSSMFLEERFFDINSVGICKGKNM